MINNCKSQSISTLLTDTVPALALSFPHPLNSSTLYNKKKKKEREWFWGGVVGSSEVELYTSTITKVLKLKTRNQPFRTFKGAEITFNTMTGKPSKR